MSQARMAYLPTGRSAAKVAAEFEPHGEYAFEYPFVTATTAASRMSTPNRAGTSSPTANPAPSDPIPVAIVC